MLITCRIHQARERTVETNPNLHEVVLTFGFDVCKENMHMKYV